MAYFHGIKTSEQPTKIVPQVEVDAGLIFAVGTAPVHLTTQAVAANTPILCYELAEYVEQFGFDGNFDAFTLDEVASAAFQLFKISPVVFVNVLDKTKHFTEVESELGGIVENPATIADPIFLDTLKVTSQGEETEVDLIEDTDYTATVTTTDDGEITTVDIKVDATLPSDTLKFIYTLDGEQVEVTKDVDDLPFELPLGASGLSIKAVTTPVNTLVADEDYTAAYNSDGEVVFTLLDDTKVYNDKVQLKYHKSAPEKVTKADIIGGYDTVTGQYKGLELIEQVFPKFRLTPGIIIAPKFSQDVTVAAIMKAKCTDINSVFYAIACVDIPTDEVKTYTAAAEYKNTKNIVDTSVIACYPKVSLGGVQYFLSTQLACLMNLVDAQRGDNIPYISPSNKNLQMDSSVLADGTEMFLSLDQANYLNGNGIVTALNFSNGWCAWGSRTSCYNSVTDPKDTFIPVRRMMNFLKNQLTLTYWQKVDSPMTKRLIESFLDSVNIYFNGLTARGVILGGRVEFREKDNPTTDLIDGKAVFHVAFTPPVPAENISFEVEFDPDYFATLFS